MKNSTANNILNDDWLPAIISIEANVSISPTPPSVVLETPDRAMDKRKKGCVYWKGSREDDTIVSTENAKAILQKKL